MNKQPQQAPETRTVPADKPTAIKINQPYVEQDDPPASWREMYLEARNHVDKLAEALRQCETVLKMIAANETDYNGRPVRYAAADSATDIENVLAEYQNAKGGE